MKTVIVLPTYNERANLELLLPQLLSQTDAHVLVVDDDSPDGTAEVVRACSSARVHLLSGEKRGLGAAYKRGMRYALEELEADVVVEMDADFSHAPTDVQRLVDALDGADFVIGSRYVEGGRIEGWGAHRYVVSWTGNLVSRLVAGLYPIKDTTAGFRAIKRWVLEEVDWDSLDTRGYGFQIRLLHEAISHGGRVAEVPVTFTDRVRGESKLGFADIREFCVTAAQLGLRTYKRLLVFLLVGLSGVLVNLGVFSASYRLFEAPFVASLALGIEASILSNFLLHDHFTFGDRRADSRISRALKYHATAFGGAAINLAVGSALFFGLGWLGELADFAGIVLATAWNWVLSSSWAWRKN